MTDFSPYHIILQNSDVEWVNQRLNLPQDAGKWIAYMLGLRYFDLTKYNITFLESFKNKLTGTFVHKDFIANVKRKNKQTQNY